MPQKSEHVFEEMEDDAHNDAPRVPDDVPRIPDARPVVLNVPVQWGDSCVGVKLGADYEWDNGFLLGVDLNMLSPIQRRRSFESLSSSPLFSLSLKLGWNLHAIFGDASMA